MNLFTPTGDTVSLAVTSTTGNVEIGNDLRGGTVRLFNAGSATVFVAFGQSTVEAETTSGMPIPAGAIEAFAVGPSVTHVGGITASGTATLYATPGQGV